MLSASVTLRDSVPPQRQGVKVGRCSGNRLHIAAPLIVSAGVGLSPLLD